VNMFARGEILITQALMATAKPKKLPQLLGQKIDRLARECSDRPDVLRAIDRFGEFAELRNVLVHMEARVFADANGGWIIQFEDWSGQIFRRISNVEGEILRRSIQREVDRLGSRLIANSRTPDQAGTPSA
jgi:hypothetical protein